MIHHQVPLVPVPNHPYAFYGTNTDPYGRFWIHFGCRACGDQSQRLCGSPARVGWWAMRYGQMHGHGLKAQPIGDQDRGVPLYGGAAPPYPHK